MTIDNPPDTDLAAHFEFGANWRRFLALVDEPRVDDAVQSLRTFLQLENTPKPLSGKRFLDAGCGSGLFSLAAVRLGAEVTSFDLDPESVGCANELRKRFASDADSWTIHEGSALDSDFLTALGMFDVVYSWGVLHHTGAMWNAIEAVSGRTKSEGKFFLAIYNDQGDLSDIWRGIKKTYVALPRFLQTPFVVVVGAGYYGARTAMAIARRAGHIVLGKNLPPQESTPNPPSGQKHYGDRGMSRWYDLIDWVGGYPFEVATPDAIVDFLAPHGFHLTKLRSVGGKLGCNELVFHLSQ